MNRRAFLSASCGLTILRAASKPADAFALIGDRYHNSDYIRTALTRTIVREAGVSVDFTDETHLLNEDTLKRYKLVIILRDGMIWPEGYPDERSNAAYLSVGAPKIVSDPPMSDAKPQPAGWLSDAQGKAFRKWVENGGAALLLHNTTYISRYNEDFRKVLGAITQDHPPIRPFKLKITNADHPVTRGVRDFIVTDEQHYMKYEGDPKNVFLRSVNEEGLDFKKLGPSCEAGWAHSFGRGRVCYLAPGHMLTVLWNAEYVKMQKNALQWLRG